MDTQDLIDYYANLLIFQYVEKPKAYATIQAIVTPVLMPQASLSDPTLPLAVQNGFNLDTAVGVQLDVLGKYQNVTRTGLDTNGSPITLDDDDFRTLIQFASFVNNSGSSLYQIQTLLDAFLPDLIYVFDFQDMRLGYFVDSGLGSLNLLALVISENLLPVPCGVQLATTVYASNIKNFFGFRTYEFAPANNTSFNSYISYQNTWPWLSYANGVT
jgi:Protein of unknown function (DUF2612)